MIVSFATPTGQIQANVPVGQTTTYSPGEAVAIAYARGDPEDATLLNGIVTSGGFAPLAGVLSVLSFLSAVSGAVQMWRNRGLGPVA